MQKDPSKALELGLAARPSTIRSSRLALANLPHDMVTDQQDPEEAGSPQRGPTTFAAATVEVALAVRMSYVRFLNTNRAGCGVVW